MKRIEIYEDNTGRFSVRIYNRSFDREEIILKKDEAFKYLQKISRDKINDIKPYGNGGFIHSIKISTDKSEIFLSEIDKLDRHEKYLSPLTSKLERELTKDKLREIKEKRTSKTPPRVTRKNKYSNKLMKAGAILAGIAIAGTLAGYIMNMPSYAETLGKDSISYTYHDENIDNELKQEYETDSPIFTNKQGEEKEYFEKPKNVENFYGDVVEIDYEDRTNTEKALNTRETYGDLITKYANTYGVDPNLMIAIATQEKGFHSSIMDDGGATGIMQIQNDVWFEKEIRAYNYETGKYDSFTVDNNKIENLESNIQIGCMYFQNCLNYFNNNIPAAIQCYNMGIDNVNVIIGAYAANKGLTRSEIINNSCDVGWMSYRSNIKVGDPNYIENVLSWLGKDNTISVFDKSNDSSVGLRIISSQTEKTF